MKRFNITLPELAGLAVLSCLVSAGMGGVLGYHYGADRMRCHLAIAVVERDLARDGVADGADYWRWCKPAWRAAEGDEQ